MSKLISLLLAHLPVPLHRLALRCAQSILELRHHVIKRPTEVCSLIVENEVGQILLIQHSYRFRGIWMLPSGRVGRHGDPVSAARRELNEEVQCTLENARLIELQNRAIWDDPRFTTYIVGGFTSLRPDADLREVERAGFFPLSELPEPIDELTLLQIERWRFRNSFSIPVPAFVRPEYLQAQLAGKG